MISLKDKKFLSLVALGIILRVLLMATTYHPDLRAAAFASYEIVNQGKIFSFYDVLPSLPTNDPLFRALGPTELNYPPLAWYTPALFRFITNSFIDPKLDYQTFVSAESLFGKREFFTHLFLLKIPLLVADLITAWLLTYFFVEKEKKKKIFLFWLFNPLTLYATFAIGQIDIWPVLFSVGAGVAFIKNRSVFGIILLGLGGGYKLFPLLFIIPMAILFGQSIWQKIKLLLVGFGTYALIIFPFVLTSPGFRTYSLLTSQTDKMLYAKVMVSGDQHLPIFIVGYVVIIFLCAFTRRQFWSIYLTAIILLLLALTHYHPQWFLWLTPWILIFLVKDSGLKWLAGTLFLADVGLTLSFDSSLHYVLFSPVFPFIVNIPYAFPGLINYFMPFAQFVSLIRGFLAGSAIVTLYELINRRIRLRI